MGNSQMPNARKEGLVIQEMPDEVLVYDLDTNKALCLNQTAAFVWRACNGEHTVADIKSLFEKKHGTTVNEDFIWLAIDQLNKDNLLQEKIASKFEGVSRREVIKKVGLASVMALPIVASLAVPNSALANTTCIAIGTCTEQSNCFGPTSCVCRGTCSISGASCTVAGGGTPCAPGDGVCQNGSCQP